jgi:hypothetical protein
VQKINLDNQTRFGYSDNNCLRQWVLQYVGLPCPVVARRAKSEAKADPQFTIFDLSALKKQCLIYPWGER